MRRLTIADQAAALVREGIRSGRWHGELPGVARMATELNVSKLTMRAALRKLEKEGLVAPQGKRHCRVIVDTPKSEDGRLLKVNLLLDRPLENLPTSHRDMCLRLFKAIEGEGHSCHILPKTQACLNYDVSNIAKHLAQTKADAWVIVQGRRDLLGWCVKQSTPSLAFGGGIVEGMVRVGGNFKILVRRVVRELVAFGHQRIVFILEERFQSPHSTAPAVVLAEFARLGIPATAPYNVPSWEASAAGLTNLLQELFRFTPPTALFLHDQRQLLATLAFLASKKICLPADVSIICGHCGDDTAWIRPSLAHFQWDVDLAMQHVCEWLRDSGHGQPKKEWQLVPSTFIPGDSIARPKSS